MKKIILILLFYINSGFYGNSQVVSSNPAIAIHNLPITVNFFANHGDLGLINYSGDIYAHTGVITDLSASSSDWKYVKTDWKVNTTACKLTRISTNEYQITISPSIREFYGVPGNEKILKLAFVFRNYDGTKTGREAGGSDLFINVYEEGTNVAFTKPSGLFYLVNYGQNIEIEAIASGHDSIQLYLDNQYIKSTITSKITYNTTASGTQKHILIAKAYKTPNIAADTAYYIVKDSTKNVTLPIGYLDGISYPDNQSATFVLYAPYKKNIYLIGDFNQWLPDNNYLMNKDGDHFWITINGLTPEKEYVCQYLIDDTLRIADPYSEKISDPWNDKSISDSIYPNLIKYPYTKSTEIATVISPGQTDYIWQNNNYTVPPKEKLIVYELLIRDYTAKKDIKTITDTLNYIAKLGVNAIELMPFNEFEGNDSWGYNPSFYFAPDKAYGTKNDYKKFIDACHKKGIAVIMDIVLNHSYSQSPLARMYMDGNKPSVLNPWYNREHNMQNLDAQWGLDFNHQSIYTKKLVDSICSYWMSEYKIDGFRFDFTKGFTNSVYGPTSWASDYDPARIAILKRIASEIWKRKSNAYIIFEHLSENNEEKELSENGIMLWGNTNYNYNQATMGYSDGWDFSWVSYKKRGWDQPNVVGYMESHDEERMVFKNITYGNSNATYNVKETATALGRMEMAATFFITIPGPKMIWQFGELGYDISINYNGRLSPKPLHWEYYSIAERHRIFRVYSFLNLLKKTEPLFSTSLFTMDVANSLKTVKLMLNSEFAIILGNFDIISKTTTISFPATGTWYDYFTGDSLILTYTDKSITLEPGEYHIFSNKKLAGFPASPLLNKTLHYQNITVFPNPCNDFIYLQNVTEPVQFTLQYISGKILTHKKYDHFIDLQKYPTGIYILTIQSKSGKKSFKIVRE